MFLRFYPPTQLHSDQGRQFESSIMSEVCKLLGIAKSRTTAYHPQCDGLVERHNRTLLAMLSTHTQEHPQSTVLGYSPAKAFFCLQLFRACFHRLQSFFSHVWQGTSTSGGRHVWCGPNRFPVIIPLRF